MNRKNPHAGNVLFPTWEQDCPTVGICSKMASPFLLIDTKKGWDFRFLFLLVLKDRILCYYLLCRYAADNLICSANNHILTS